MADKAYLFGMIVTTGLAFLLIVFCYAQIYCSLTYETRHSKGESSVAKKMALLVFTDFLCWAPVAFFSLTALAGYPLMGVTESKILLVFFYPINSCANPYLYAIMTAQYRKDLLALLVRWRCYPRYPLRRELVGFLIADGAFVGGRSAGTRSLQRPLATT